jgi:hypothetical protein
MMFIQTLAVVSLITFSHACATFDATYNLISTEISGTITDNGKKTCTYSGKTNQKQLFATCISGFASYVTGDLNYASYSNHGHEGNIDLGMKEINDNEVQVIGRAFDC